MSVSGYIVMWDVVEVPYKKIVEAWKTALPGQVMPDLAKPPEEVLREALDAYVRENSKAFWRKRGSAFLLLIHKVVDPGLGIIPGGPGAHDKFVPILVFDVESGRLRVRDIEGNSITVYKNSEASPLNILRSIAESIQVAFDSRVKTCSARDMSAWLTDVAVTVGRGAKLRNGVYFIPKDYFQKWREVCDALRYVVDHRFYEVPVESSPALDTVVADAVIRQVDETIAKIDADDFFNPDLPTLLRTRFDHVARENKRRTLLVGEVNAQLGIYEEIFEDRLDVQDKIVALRAKLASAMLKIEEEKEPA